ncbi:methylthioribose-1-phosphate isomerase [Kineosphaera limosa]|uniref:Methylthioribose-1-phosphate isomerase n=1 Tax=Kineosphaera limosa NBRC 100340 TaxID=1184609 RepID=K6XC77_9MICO|nr:S-methyl-5-thioribose-1-phosphate isomerase [Kineosphaera limosa]NYE00792.1 methylthioribose-1-phosphate isomerase [Kineosphaera limosa]GAB96404.1 methylthioribose-1-phosphate isomerase [Kineosphaera limosa NBRC 100340]
MAEADNHRQPDDPPVQFRALEWVPQPAHLRLLDQRELPRRETYLQITEVDALVAAIVTLAVRGAPALGAAGALGVVVALEQAEREGWDESRLRAEIDRIRDARPTAVNLAWGVDEALGRRADGREAVLAAALQIVADDEAANRELSRVGADWLLARTGRERLRIVTHCNTGALATTAWGTAYGIIHELYTRGAVDLVYADETRPLLQGARLTSWELTRDGIEHVVQADGAAASTILRGLADAAIIGADRIAANADTANKIGSVALALACARAGIPFVVAAPSSTVDLRTPSGAQIRIEERDGAEVVTFDGAAIAPPGTRGFNPAFDVTPADLIAAVVTEHGVVEPARDPDPRIMERIAG